MSFWKSKLVKARKEHKCQFCGFKIEKGGLKTQGGLYFEKHELAFLVEVLKEIKVC